MFDDFVGLAFKVYNAIFANFVTLLNWGGKQKKIGDLVMDCKIWTNLNFQEMFTHLNCSQRLHEIGQYIKLTN